jgi:hypothetical protein
MGQERSPRPSAAAAAQRPQELALDPVALVELMELMERPHRGQLAVDRRRRAVIDRPRQVGDIAGALRG